MNKTNNSSIATAVAALGATIEEQERTISWLKLDKEGLEKKIEELRREMLALKIDQHNQLNGETGESHRKEAAK